ncbi:hypothetical protein M0804_002408 [Polistes exclamans]|nr:hypothetical protein M0804_002408 [Polistes exclamans]
MDGAGTAVVVGYTYRMVRMIGDEFLTEERDRKYYADHYTCCPPPLFIILITLVEKRTSREIHRKEEKGDGGGGGGGGIAAGTSSLQFRVDTWASSLITPWQRARLIPRVQYRSTVSSSTGRTNASSFGGSPSICSFMLGSLGTSVFDTDVYLVGASGGVYALLAAHLANVLLNYNNMEFGIVRLIGIFVIASADVGFAIYDRYAAEQIYAGLPVSYVAHLTGALAGLTIGLLVLKNFEQRLHEQLLWWVALGVYAACTIFAVMYNLMHPNYP